MKIRSLVLLLTMSGAVAAAPAKNKKDALPPLFCQAQHVYVQTATGDPQQPGAAPEDRAATIALIAQIQSWKRYVVVTDPQQAELIWVVRAGRSATPGNSNGGLGSGSSTNQDASGMGANPGGASRNGQGSGQGGMNGTGSSGGQGGLDGPGGMNGGDSTGAGANGNRGPAESSGGKADDVLAIFQRPDGGPLTSPLWQRNQRNGLEMPKMQLFQQIRSAVDATCPVPAPGAAPGQPAAPQP